MTALKDRIQTAANSVKTGKALIETSIIKSGGTVPKANAIPTFAELCGGVNNLHKIKITTSINPVVFSESGGDIEVTINSNTVVEVKVPEGIEIKSNQYPFMGDIRRSYGSTKYIFTRYGWNVSSEYRGNITIRALVNDVAEERIINCKQPVASSILFGFEYTPEQADDRVDYIGDAAINRNRPIQTMMRPFEMKTDGTDKAYLQNDVRLRINGSVSHLSNPTYLQLVEIAEFWYGFVYDKVRNKNQVWFSNKPISGYMHIAPQAICRYAGYIDANGYGRSHSGRIRSNYKTLKEFNTAAQKTRADMFVMNYYLWNALALLMVHDFGRRNTHAVYGDIQWDPKDIAGGTTDILTTPSGVADIYSREVICKSFRWRFLECIYSSHSLWLFGTIHADALYICSNPYNSNTDGTIDANYKKVGGMERRGHILDVSLPWIFVKTTGGSSTTGFCDYNSVWNHGYVCSLITSYGLEVGPFALSCNVFDGRGSHLCALFAIISRESAATQVVTPPLGA